MSELLDELVQIVGNHNVRVGADVRAVDYGGLKENLTADLLISPANTDEVSKIVKACSAHCVAVIAQGGRTGLVGGGRTQQADVIVATNRLNTVELIDPVERSAVVQSGVTLQQLRDAAAKFGLEPGIDLPSRGTATIGGMASTNAGGISAFRNGVMRHQILGLEAVLPDGSIYRDLTRVVKNSAGYDLKHLLIGAEGTLGVITRIVVKLENLPTNTATALFGFRSVDSALEALQSVLELKRGRLRSAEAMWSEFFEFTSDHFSWSFPDDQGVCELYLLLSITGGTDDELQESLLELYDMLERRQGPTPAVVASSGIQESELWRLREDTELIYRKYPGAPSFDVSVPLSRLDTYMKQTVARLSRAPFAFRPFVFGHIADGNLHIIIDRPATDISIDEIRLVESILYDGLTELGGSFSAEHGVGSKRIRALQDTGDKTKLRLMNEIKGLLDPKNIMNPGKVLPASR